MADYRLIIDLVTKYSDLGLNTFINATKLAAQETNKFNKQLADISTYADLEAKGLTNAMGSLTEFATAQAKLAEQTQIDQSTIAKEISMATDTSVEGLHALATEFGVDFNAATKLNTKLDAQYKLLKTGTEWSNKFRVGWLSLMFMAQRWGQEVAKATKPAEDLLGVEELRNELLAIKGLPLAKEKLEATLKEAEAIANMSDEELAAYNNNLKLQEALSGGLESLSNWMLTIWASVGVLKEFTSWVKNIPAALTVLKEAFEGIGTGLYTVLSTNLTDLVNHWGTMSAWSKIGVAFGAALIAVGTFLVTYNIFAEWGKQMAEQWGSAFGRSVLIAVGVTLAAIAGILALSGVGIGASIAAGAASAAAFTAAALIPADAAEQAENEAYINALGNSNYASATGPIPGVDYQRPNVMVNNTIIDPDVKTFTSELERYFDSVATTV